MKKFLLIFCLCFKIQGWAIDNRAGTLSCSTPFTLSESNQRATTLETFINENGESAILWLERGNRLYITFPSADKKWSPREQILQDEQQLQSPQLFIDSQGTVCVIAKNSAHYYQENQDLFIRKEKINKPWSSKKSIIKLADHLYSVNYYFDNKGNILVQGFESKSPFPYLTINPKVIKYDYINLKRDWDEFFPKSDIKALPQGMVINRNGKGCAFFTSNKNNGQTLQMNTYREGKINTKELKNLLDNIGNNDSSFRRFQAAINQKEQIAAIWERWDDTRVIIETTDYMEEKEQKKPFLKVLDFCKLPVSSSGPKIMIDESGNIVAIWVAVHSKNTAIVYVAHKLAGKEWSSSYPISDSTKFCDKFVCAHDVKGHFVIVWDEYSSTERSIQGATFRPEIETWSSPVTLSPPKVVASHPSIAFNEKGDGLIAWEAENDGRIYIQTSDIKLN